MKKLDRFILKAFIGPFFAILFVVIFILMMQFLWLYIDELVGKGLGLGIIMEFLMWGTCTILPLALPLATLLASMMTMGQMGENYELTAIKSAGISLSRILKPLIIASLVISGVAFYASNNLVPVAFNKIYTLRDDIGRTKEEIKIPSGVFYDGIEGYILRVKDRDEKSDIMRGIMVYDHSDRKGNNKLTLADSAMIKMSKNKSYLTFTLFNGVNYMENNKWTYRDTSLNLQRIDFTKQELVIPLKNYAFSKSENARYGNQVKAMNLDQLTHGKDSLEKVKSVELSRQLKTLPTSTCLLLKEQLDSAGTAGIRSPFKCEKYLEWRNLDSKIMSLERASSNANQFSANLTDCWREAYEYSYILRRTNVEILRKFAQALACFIMFFLGAPIGALIRKGGLGTPAIVAVLFFVLYWVIDITGIKLARDGAISASLGVYISTIVLFPTGLFLTWKAIHDSSIINLENFNTWRKTISRKFMNMFKKTRIVYFGTPEFAVAPLDALIKNNFKVVGIVTVPDKPSGRGLEVNQSAVKKYAVENEIPVLQPEKLKDPAFLEQLSALKADLFVVVAFRMLPEEVWQMPKLGTFNLHAALLPQYRGAAPINWAVINGESRTGVTTFMIDKNIDTGGILLRQDVRIDRNDNAGDVHDRLMEIGSNLVVQTTTGLIEHQLETRVQRSFIMGSEKLKPAPKIHKELCFIDWNDESETIRNLIRGLSPYPAAFTKIAFDEELKSAFDKRDGIKDSQKRKKEKPKTLKIYASETVSGSNLDELIAQCEIAPLQKELTPGTVLSDGKTFFAITTANGALLIEELQLSGKKRMSVEDFLKGFREPMCHKTINGTSKDVLEGISHSSRRG